VRLFKTKRGLPESDLGAVSAGELVSVPEYATEKAINNNDKASLNKDLRFSIFIFLKRIKLNLHHKLSAFQRQVFTDTR
jgi:hypothetical protein